MAVLPLAISQPSIPHATLPLTPMSTIYFQPSCRGGQDEIEQKKDFPQTVELILVDVEAPTPEAAEAPGPGLLVMQCGAQGAISETSSRHCARLSRWAFPVTFPKIRNREFSEENGRTNSISGEFFGSLAFRRMSASFG